MENTQELQYFYNDGLKECSWIPNNLDDFLQYCQSKSVNIDNESIVITCGDKDFLYLDTIYVIKSRRNEGIATRKILELKGRVALICNKNLTPFYSALGFTNNLPYDIVIKDNR